MTSLPKPHCQALTCGNSSFEEALNATDIIHEICLAYLTLKC
jgi:hypothetical protein